MWIKAFHTVLHGLKQAFVVSQEGGSCLRSADWHLIAAVQWCSFAAAARPFLCLGRVGSSLCWSMLSAFESCVSQHYCLVLFYYCDSISMFSKNGVCLGFLFVCLVWFLSLTDFSSIISVVFYLTKSVFLKSNVSLCTVQLLSLNHRGKE